MGGYGGYAPSWPLGVMQGLLGYPSQATQLQMNAQMQAYYSGAAYGMQMAQLERAVFGMWGAPRPSRIKCEYCGRTYERGKEPDSCVGCGAPVKH